MAGALIRSISTGSPSEVLQGHQRLAAHKFTGKKIWVDAVDLSQRDLASENARGTSYPARVLIAVTAHSNIAKNRWG